MQPQQAPQPSREEFVKSLFLLEPKDNVYSGKEARKGLVKGIMKGVDAIKVSYGPAGSNAIIQDEMYPYHRITNDGKSILQSIKLGNALENIGLNQLKEVADKSDKESGDGRKTSIVLTGAILEEGMKIDALVPIELKKSLDECLPIILKSIDDQTTQITINEVGKIAEIASESEYIGNLFKEMYGIIGNDGVVELDNSNLPETFYEITEGVRLRNCGFHYPYMANEDKGRKAVYKNPYVLVTKQKLTNVTQLDPLIKAILKQGRDELVIFCDEIDLSVSQALAYLHMQGIEKDGMFIRFKTLVIKAPTLWKDWLFEDFSKITGATIIDPGQGTTLKNLQIHHLGFCDKITTSKEETLVLSSKDISEHIQKLQDENTDESNLRLIWLKTKTAILKVGAHSESELSYLKGKALDARNASYLALKGGIIPGGGLTFLKALKTLPDTVGGTILKKALQYPYKQICENLGITESKKTTAFKDIHDPAIVVKNAIINALSVASTVLTTDVIVTK